MFGSSKINDDSVKLKAFIDVALNKYGNLPMKQLAEAARNEYRYTCSGSTRRPGNVFFCLKNLIYFCLILQNL